MKGVIWPSTVVIVDDNIGFLHGLADCFEGEEYNVVLFSDPINALEFINNQNSINKLDITSLLVKSFTEASLGIDLLKLQETMKSHNKSEVISVVVSDFDMPGINGIELFNKIAPQNIKKIMLTSKLDVENALEIKGEIIDDFQDKIGKDFVVNLKLKIKKLIERYFAEFAIPIEIIIKKTVESPLIDKEFISYMEEIIKTKGIIEYYLLEYSGSYMMIDKMKKTYLFLCQNKSQMKANINDFLEIQEVHQKLSSYKYQIAKYQNEKIILPDDNESNLIDYIYPVEVIIKDTWYLSIVPINAQNIFHEYVQVIQLRIN